MSAREAARPGSVPRAESDDRLREALRSLPATAPGPGFTAQVLARLAARGAAAPPRRAPRWATAALLLLLVGALGWVATERHGRLQRSARLRAETAALARELANLRAEAAEPAPMIYLGGSEEVDLVLDLSSLPMAAALPAPLSPSATTPN
jgi:hypothetical protein